jgi:hypothetical protein
MLRDESKMENSPMRYKRLLPWLGAVLVAGTVGAPSAWAAPENVVVIRSVVVGDGLHGAFLGSDSPFVFTGRFSDRVEKSLGGTPPNPLQPDITTNGSGIADQDSMIDPGAGIFVAKGMAEIGNLVDRDLGFARSSVDVSFDLLTPHRYTLSGALEVGTDGGLGVAALSLAGPTSIGFKKGSWGEAVKLDAAGILAPGSYHLSLYALIQPSCEREQCSAGSWMGGASSFDMDLRVAAVPEPGTYTMLLAGLGALGFVVRRRSARAA